jgi:hypothetical protein
VFVASRKQFISSREIGIGDRLHAIGYFRVDFLVLPL